MPTAEKGSYDSQDGKDELEHESLVVARIEFMPAGAIDRIHKLLIAKHDRVSATHREVVRFKDT